MKKIALKSFKLVSTVTISFSVAFAGPETSYDQDPRNKGYDSCNSSNDSYLVNNGKPVQTYFGVCDAFDILKYKSAENRESEAYLEQKTYRDNRAAEYQNASGLVADYGNQLNTSADMLEQFDIDRDNLEIRREKELDRLDHIQDDQERTVRNIMIEVQRMDQINGQIDQRNRVSNGRTRDKRNIPRRPGKIGNNNNNRSRADKNNKNNDDNDIKSAMEANRFLQRLLSVVDGVQKEIQTNLQKASASRSEIEYNKRREIESYKKIEDTKIEPFEQKARAARTSGDQLRQALQQAQAELKKAQQAQSNSNYKPTPGGANAPKIAEANTEIAKLKAEWNGKKSPIEKQIGNSSKEIGTLEARIRALTVQANNERMPPPGPAASRDGRTPMPTSPNNGRSSGNPNQRPMPTGTIRDEIARLQKVVQDLQASITAAQGQLSAIASEYESKIAAQNKIIADLIAAGQNTTDPQSEKLQAAVSSAQEKVNQADKDAKAQDELYKAARASADPLIQTREARIRAIGQEMANQLAPFQQKIVRLDSKRVELQRSEEALRSVLNVRTNFISEYLQLSRANDVQYNNEYNRYQTTAAQLQVAEERLNAAIPALRQADESLSMLETKLREASKRTAWVQKNLDDAFEYIKAYATELAVNEGAQMAAPIAKARGEYEGRLIGVDQARGQVFGQKSGELRAYKYGQKEGTELGQLQGISEVTLRANEDGTSRGKNCQIGGSDCHPKGAQAGKTSGETRAEEYIKKVEKPFYEDGFKKQNDERRNIKLNEAKKTSQISFSSQKRGIASEQKQFDLEQEAVHATDRAREEFITSLNLDKLGHPFLVDVFNFHFSTSFKQGFNGTYYDALMSSKNLSVAEAMQGKDGNSGELGRLKKLLDSPKYKNDNEAHLKLKESGDLAPQKNNPLGSADYNRVRDERDKEVYAKQKETRKEEFRASTYEAIVQQKDSEGLGKSAYNTKYDSSWSSATQSTVEDLYEAKYKLDNEEKRKAQQAELGKEKANNLFDNNAIIEIDDAMTRLVESEQDGFFRPGEAVYLQMVIRNYGNKGIVANDVKSISTTLQTRGIKLDQKFEIPEIPAKSSLNFYPVAKFSLDSNSSATNEPFEVSLEVNYPKISGFLVDHVMYQKKLTGQPTYPITWSAQYDAGDGTPRDVFNDNSGEPTIVVSPGRKVDLKIKLNNLSSTASFSDLKTSIEIVDSSFVSAEKSEDQVSVSPKSSAETTLTLAGSTEKEMQFKKTRATIFVKKEGLNFARPIELSVILKPTWNFNENNKGLLLSRDLGKGNSRNFYSLRLQEGFKDFLFDTWDVGIDGAMKDLSVLNKYRKKGIHILADKNNDLDESTLRQVIGFANQGGLVMLWGHEMGQSKTAQSILAAIGSGVSFAADSDLAARDAIRGNRAYEGASSKDFVDARIARMGVSSPFRSYPAIYIGQSLVATSSFIGNFDEKRAYVLDDNGRVVTVGISVEDLVEKSPKLMAMMITLAQHSAIKFWDKIGNAKADPRLWVQFVIDDVVDEMYWATQNPDLAEAVYDDNWTENRSRLHETADELLRWPQEFKGDELDNRTDTPRYHTAFALGKFLAPLKSLKQRNSSATEELFSAIRENQVKVGMSKGIFGKSKVMQSWKEVLCVNVGPKTQAQAANAICSQM